jgi:hypothetical protein
LTSYKINKKDNNMDVFWSVAECASIPHINYEEPRPVLPEISKIVPAYADVKNRITSCPAFRDVCRNTYSLHIPVEYELTFANNDVSTTLWDRQFFTDVVTVRDFKYPNWLHMQFKYVFIAESDLEMEVMPCFLTSNSFTDNADLIPGKMNISKWFRPTDCAFVVKPGDRTITFNQGDAYSFVRFHTDENIRLRRFFMTPELNHITVSNLSSRNYKRKPIPLDYFYKLYQRSFMHSKILKEVKKNLME